MWRTSEGDRILKGGEAELFRKGVSSLACHLADAFECYEFATGEKVFDRLTHAQKIAMLDLVSRALLYQNARCPALSGVNEATVAAVYAHIGREIVIETDESESLFWRRLVRAACKGIGWGRSAMPNLHCENDGKWRDVIEELLDEILWDRDHELEDIFLDMPPDDSRAARAAAGVSGPYFRTIALEPSAEQLRRMEQRLSRIRA